MMYKIKDFPVLSIENAKIVVQRLNRDCRSYDMDGFWTEKIIPGCKKKYK